jgi:dinuclear metal center YbgI/SA1388 family protein
MMTIKELNNYLKNYLDPLKMEDTSTNGIEMNRDGSIKKVGFAVDASLATIQQAINEKCDCLIVHHGLLWGRPLPIDGSYYDKVKLMIENNLGLIGYHLPLDAHQEVGNNAVMANLIGLTNLTAISCGYRGTLLKPLTIKEITTKLGINLNDQGVTYLPFGNDQISKVTIISGGGFSSLPLSISLGDDLYITGEIPHYTYHMAKEGHINLLAGGHYYTETFGVKALAKHLQEKFKLGTVFIDHPTGL